MILALTLVAGCFAPPARDLERDKAMGTSADRLKPRSRGPVDANRPMPGDPPPPAADEDVARLASLDKIERIQANNRLRARGAEGVLAAAGFVAKAGVEPQAVAEAIGFVGAADLAALDDAQEAQVRKHLAAALGHADGAVRTAAARALQIHGPGDYRTAFLNAIGDPERGVRWAVVDRFGANPGEITKAQRLILIGFLQAGTAKEFEGLDANHDRELTPAEFLRSDDDFKRLDADRNGSISPKEWTSPFDSAIRADVCALLVTLHQKLTADKRPVVYNPYAPAGEQQEAVIAWQTWAQSVPD